MSRLNHECWSLFVIYKDLRLGRRQWGARVIMILRVGCPPIRCYLKTERPAVVGYSDGPAPAAKPEVARARGGRPGGGGGFFRRDRRTARRAPAQTSGSGPTGARAARTHAKGPLAPEPAAPHPTWLPGRAPRRGPVPLRLRKQWTGRPDSDRSLDSYVHTAPGHTRPSSS
jgi:hypothetical protein